MALAPADCPTQLPTQYRQALERFTTVFGKGTGGTTPPAPPGPPCLTSDEPCGLARSSPEPTLEGSEWLMSTRGRRGVIVLSVRR